MERPIILFLSSTSLHFPLDLHDILTNEGQESKRYESIDDFLSTPDRHTPYVAVLEIGSTEDVDRALFAYEWCEQIQPIAPCRTILLLASKNIQLGDRAARFGSAEVAHLPLPLKNLLFKIDLQKRLLASDQAQAAAEREKQAPEEFSASFVERPPKLDRVLLVRGPGPKQGYWQEAGESPAGKVRWRWVSTQKPEDLTPAEKAGVTWAADSQVKPIYEEASQAWAIADPEADLVGFKKDKPVFSARTSFRQPKVAGTAGEKQNFAREKTAPESDRAFAEEARAHGAAGVIEAPADAKPETATEVKQARAAAEATEKNFGHQAAQAPAAQSFGKPAAPAASGRQVIRPAEEKTAETITPARAKAGTAAPAWENHSAPGAPARHPVNQPRAAAPAPASRAEAEKPSAPGAAPPPAEEKPETIPVHYQEEEPEVNSGYSVPVSSEVEGRAPKQPAAPADETYSTRAPEHPRKEADYSATLPEKTKSIYQESSGQKAPRPRAEAGAPAPAEPKTSRAMVSEEPVAPGAAKPETAAPARPGPAKAREARAPAPRPEAAEAARGEPAVNTRSAPGAAPGAETHLPADAPARAETVTHAAGQGAEQGKEEIKLRRDAEPRQTKVAIEGTTEHSGEEIRIRARTESGAAPAGRPAKEGTENFLQYRHFVTMTLDELNDRDSSWHPMHRYRIYLSANHRYYGVKDPASLLPLWVYEGELAPEFLEDKRAWKFYDRYPELYSTLDTLPPVVLDQIYVMAGKPPPGSYADGPAPGAGVTEGSAAPAPAAATQNEAVPGHGLWGSVKSFFRKLIGR